MSKTTIDSHADYVVHNSVVTESSTIIRVAGGLSANCRRRGGIKGPKITGLRPRESIFTQFATPLVRDKRAPVQTNTRGVGPWFTERKGRIRRSVVGTGQGAHGRTRSGSGLFSTSTLRRLSHLFRRAERALNPRRTSTS